MSADGGGNVYSIRHWRGVAMFVMTAGVVDTFEKGCPAAGFFSDPPEDKHSKSHKITLEVLQWWINGGYSENKQLEIHFFIHQDSGRETEFPANDTLLVLLLSRLLFWVLGG